MPGVHKNPGKWLELEVLREVRWLATITVLPCFLGYRTVLLYMVGSNSPKVTLSQSLHGMKKRKEHSFMNSQEAANLTLSQRQLLCRLGNPKEAKRLHFQVTSSTVLWKQLRSSGQDAIDRVIVPESCPRENNMTVLHVDYEE